jgi:activating signal cointegrator complex subunit 1
LSNADEATLAELSDLVPMFEVLMHTSKVHLLQSIVSSVLVDMVFNAYYVGLSSEQTDHFRKMEQLLLSFSMSSPPRLPWPLT